MVYKLNENKSLSDNLEYSCATTVSYTHLTLPTN
jgi:hypothetical protein